MYKAIAWQLGLPVERNRASAYRAIHTEVCRPAIECRIHPVLVVDEAQHLRNDVLEDLRLLANYAMDSERRLCLLLVGLTELRRRLAGTSLPLFEPSAVQALYQATYGLPRKVNLVAHYALSAAALAKARQITAEHVHSALEEVQRSAPSSSCP
ncbi:MAG: AAA family ATPase [Rubrivivax sp.]|nr:AAA family ATPase [Rubrivivax sp.]